ncbi:unnamed protein product, partial [Ilex paraguariensis]
NQKIFNDVPPNAYGTVLKGKGSWTESLILEDMYCAEKQTIPMSNVEMVQQQSSGILICCDGGFKKRTKEAASAVLIFNPKGGLMDGTSKAFFANSSLVAEAVAIWHVCVMVDACSIKNATILSDCLIAIKLSAMENVPHGKSTQ